MRNIKAIPVLRGTHCRYPGQSSLHRLKGILGWPGTLCCKITSPMVLRTLSWPRVGTFDFWCIARYLLPFSWRPSTIISDGPGLEEPKRNSQCFHGSFCNDRLISNPDFFFFSSHPGFQVLNYLSHTGPSKGSWECSIEKCFWALLNIPPWGNF